MPAYCKFEFITFESKLLITVNGESGDDLSELKIHEKALESDTEGFVNISESIPRLRAKAFHITG